jgi:hypothetical protein
LGTSHLIFQHWVNDAVEEDSEFRRFEEPGCPVRANEVSINGENVSERRKIVVGK